MSYERVNWENAPSEETPVNAENLNNMDTGIKVNADDIDVIKTVSGTVTVDADSSEEITHNLGSENVVVTVAADRGDYFDPGFDVGYSITDSNNIRVHNNYSGTSTQTIRYTVTRTG